MPLLCGADGPTIQKSKFYFTIPEIVYHQADDDTHLRCDDMQPAGLMICTHSRDDIPSLVGLDKQKALTIVSAFGGNLNFI